MCVPLIIWAVYIGELYGSDSSIHMIVKERSPKEIKWTLGCLPTWQLQYREAEATACLSFKNNFSVSGPKPDIQSTHMSFYL